MIVLDVASYCDNCQDFESEMEKFPSGMISGVTKYNTMVRCAHRTRCRSIYERIAAEMILQTEEAEGRTGAEKVGGDY